MSRIGVEPFSQDLMWPQRREFGLDGRVMLVGRTDQHAMPLPAAGLRWLDEHQHLTPEEVRGEPTEHSLRKEGRVLGKRIENPLVIERLLHVILRIMSASILHPREADE
jgi:hypothetical protein